MKFFTVLAQALVFAVLMVLMLLVVAILAGLLVRLFVWVWLA